MSRISWNKGVWFVGWVSSFAWKPYIKWTFICVLANCFQKASPSCPVSSKIYLSHDKSSISMPMPDKWGMSANTPSLSKYKMTLFDCPSITPLTLLKAFMLWEMCTSVLEWNVPFYVSDKGVLIVLILCICCWVQHSENNKRWTSANVVNLFLHVLPDTECGFLMSHSHGKPVCASLKDRKVRQIRCKLQMNRLHSVLVI